MSPDVILPLFVAYPLFMAAVAVVCPVKWLRDAIHLAVPVTIAAAGVWLFQYTATHGPLAHVIGLYPAGVGIVFAADELSALMMVATMVVASISNWFATAVGETRSRFYPTLTLILITGVAGALLTADLFNFFVMIEVMLLPSYGLIAMAGGRDRLRGARVFILTNLAASTLLLVGVGMVYAVTGAVNIAALEGAAAGNGPVTVAMALVMIALAAKAGVFPLHTWLPRTYPNGSAAVMALFSGLHTKVAVYMIFRIYVVIFDLEDRYVWLLAPIMVISMIIGSFAGLAEFSMRKILSYQMVTGMPFILAMLIFAPDNPQVAFAAGIAYTLHHMITVGALLLASGAVEETYGTGQIVQLSGLARRDKLTAAVFAAAALSVVGFPPFSGVWGKVMLLFAAAEPGDARSIVIITAMIIASFGALLSMMQLWRSVFWGPDMQSVATELRIRSALTAPSAAFMMISVGMLVFAGPLTSAINTASEALIDVPSYSSAVLGEDPVGIPNTDELQGGR